MIGQSDGSGKLWLLADTMHVILFKSTLFSPFFLFVGFTLYWHSPPCVVDCVVPTGVAWANNRLSPTRLLERANNHHAMNATDLSWKLDESIPKSDTRKSLRIAKHGAPDKPVNKCPIRFTYNHTVCCRIYHNCFLLWFSFFFSSVVNVHRARAECECGNSPKKTHREITFAILFFPVRTI